MDENRIACGRTSDADPMVSCLDEGKIANAILLASEGRIDAAIAQVSAIIQLYPTVRSLYPLGCELFLRAGRTDVPPAWIAAAVSRDARFKQPFLDMAVRLFDASRVDAALEVIAAILSVDGSDQNALNNFAVMLASKAGVLLSTAEDTLRKASALSPDSREIRDNLNTLTELRKSFSSHGFLIPQRDAEAPSMPKTGLADLMAEGEGLFSKGMYNEALTIFRCIAAFDPCNHEAWNNLGVASLALGDLTEAERGIRRALSLKSDYPDALENLRKLDAMVAERAASGSGPAAVPLKGTAPFRSNLDELVRLLKDTGIETLTFDDGNTFLSYITGNEQQLKRRQAEEALIAKNAGMESWHIMGRCEYCQTVTEMSVQTKPGERPNLREGLICAQCRLINRMRFMAHLLGIALRLFPSPASCYFYEQQTFFFGCIKKKYSSIANITGSEFLGLDKKSGEIINGLRHEDALNMSFADASFDIIVSNDVFEHVADIDKALSEAHRVLRPGGIALISVPYHSTHDTTVVRSRLVNGQYVHMLPDMYHGKGWLVVYDFGKDFFDIVKKAGFSRVTLLGYHSFEYGYIGGGLQTVFIAEK